MKKAEEIVLKSGIEIHQQLDTNKLFCECPNILRQEEPNYKIERKLHIIAGESGEIDKAAQHEAEKDKTFIYEAYNDNTCLVELDEEPPHKINPEALKIALQISLLLNCEIITYSQIMRKTVIDGSNTSGFQRTLMLAKNGYIETSQGKVGIQSVLLEEDAARIVKQEKSQTTYRLDRLGIPLVEIATSPDIKTPEQAKEAALQIGDILRACKVKRGLGTIRQDVNLSIKLGEKQGERIEIKGVQEPELIIKTIKTETERQINLVKQGKSKPEVRKAKEDGTTEFLRPMPGAARMYPETDLSLLHISREQINEAKSNLPKLKAEIKAELKSQGLNEEMSKLLLSENKLEEFKELLHIHNNPNLIVKLLILWQKEIKTKLKKVKQVTLDALESILQALESKKIMENEAKIILQKIMEGLDIKEAIKIEKIDNIEEEILKLIKEKPGLSPNAYMGLIMVKFKGKINPKEIMDIILRFTKN